MRSEGVIEPVNVKDARRLMRSGLDHHSDTRSALVIADLTRLVGFKGPRGGLPLERTRTHGCQAEHSNEGVQAETPDNCHVPMRARYPGLDLRGSITILAADVGQLLLEEGQQ